MPSGHKIAARSIATGQSVRGYNQIIGFATKPISSGEHVHGHNLEVHSFERDYAFCVDAKPTSYVSPAATFRGIVRSDGRVGTRNYLGVLTTVNCSATVAKKISEAFTSAALMNYQTVIVFCPFIHTTAAHPII